MTTPALRALGRVAPTGTPGLRRVVRAGLARVFGPPPFDPHADPGDPGLFGPGSASWEVIAEPAAIVGGVRALLVQLLHPLAMAGVADHSAFRADPLGRLQRTSGYVTAITFGSTPEALGVSRDVRRVHRTVVGRAPGDRDYRADDPHLLTWVSTALTSSFLATDRAYSPRPVTGERADAFVAEQSRAAALLDRRVDLEAMAGDADALLALQRGDLDLPMLTGGDLPRTVDELQTALDAFRPSLAVNEQGREALHFLLWPDLPVPVRAAYLPLAAGALATVPPPLRGLLGVPTSRTLAAAARAQTRTLLTAMRLATGPSPSRAAADARARA